MAIDEYLAPALERALRARLLAASSEAVANAAAAALQQVRWVFGLTWRHVSPCRVNKQGRATFSARPSAFQRLLKGPYTSKNALPPQPDEEHEEAIERIESSRRVLALGWV